MDILAAADMKPLRGPVESQYTSPPTKSALIRAKLRAGQTPKQVHFEMGVSYSTIRSASKHGDKRGRPRKR